MRGLGEFRTGSIGEPVEAAAADTLPLKPACRDEARGGRPHEVLADADAVADLDEAAHPEHLAPGDDNVAIDGDDEGGGPQLKPLHQPLYQCILGHIHQQSLLSRG